MALSTLNCLTNGFGISLMNSSTNSNLSATIATVSRARPKKKSLCFVTILKSGALTVSSTSCILSSPSHASLNKCWSARMAVIWCKYQKRILTNEVAHLCVIREAAGEYGTRPLYKTLGYFSIIGLVRVNCLMGDYMLALKMMDNVALSRKVSIKVTIGGALNR